MKALSGNGLLRKTMSGMVMLFAIFVFLTLHACTPAPPVDASAEEVLEKLVAALAGEDQEGVLSLMTDSAVRRYAPVLIDGALFKATKGNATQAPVVLIDGESYKEFGFRRELRGMNLSTTIAMVKGNKGWRVDSI